MFIQQMARTTPVAAVCIALLGPTAALASVIRYVQGGILIGASGVIVNGQSYTVSFIDGTCAGVFGSCVTSAFEFQALSGH